MLVSDRIKKTAVLAAALLPGMAMAQDPVNAVNTGDTAWVLTASALVMLMTPGLAFFYAGMVRSKNAVSTLMQNFVALAVLGIMWAVCGYSLSFGAGNSIIGGLQWFMLNGVGQTPNADYAATIPHNTFMIFQCMFAVITPILITGTIAERVKFKGLLAFLVVWSLAVYYPVAHWVWGVGGLVRNMGALDFAGGMVVHMTAGFSALVLAILIKSRHDFNKTETRPHDIGWVMLGTGMLWFGWFGFNAGSALGANGLAGHAFCTTFFASAAAFLTWMCVDWIRKGKPSAMGAGVGAVAGLVCITPGAGFVTFGAAILYGILAGSVCNIAVSIIKEKFKLDDTLDVIGCHGVGGFMGTILTALFATKTVNPAGADGLFYGDATLLKAHIIGSLAVIAISCVGTFVCYWVVNAIFGMRVTQGEETQGLDWTQHGELVNSQCETTGNNNNKPHGSDLKMAR